MTGLGNIPAAHLQPTEVNFNFKSTRDPETKEVIPARPKMTLTLPLPTFEGLVASLESDSPENPVVQNYIMRLVRDDVIHGSSYSGE
jgi:hypothetical protein